MLVNLFFLLQTKINNTRQTIQNKQPSKLGILKVLKLFILEISFIIIKYLLILFKHPTESFKVLVNQPALAVCPYSYTDHKSFQKRLRFFSFATLTAIVSTTIISTLILNLATGPIFQSKAATYTFTQTNWNGGQTANNATHTSNQTGWTEYSAKDTSLTTVNSGADLQLVSAPTVNEYTIGALANINVDATAVTDNANGTWTITLGITDLSRIFKNDKFKDEASPQKSWKILSSFDSANKIIVWDSEGNGGSPSAAGASQATVGRWYASISLWEAGREGNLVTRGAIERGLPYYDGSADTNRVTIAGWTTDATHYIEIYVPLSERHQGKWDTGKYILSVSNIVIEILDPNVRIEGLQITVTGAPSTPYGIYVNGGNGDVRISNNIIKNEATANSRRGIDALYSAKIWNNIVYDQVSNGIRVLGWNNSTSYVYNNTVYNSGTGIAQANGHTMVINNNIANGNTTDYSGTFDASSSNNISQDATSPNISLRSKTVPFVDVTNKDFHLEFRDGTGNPAMNAGADLSADFTADIDNDTRSGTWDIGADDVGAALVKVHSIGTTSRNFATLQGWEDARDGVLTTRNVFKTTGQTGGAFAADQTIKGCTSTATGTYIPEQDTPSAAETYMTLDIITGTFSASETVMVSTDSCATPTGPRATLSTILTTAGTIERGEAYKDSTFTTKVYIDNSITDATHYMWLTAEPGSRHTGVAGTGVRLTIGSVAFHSIQIADAYTKIEWFEIYGATDGRFGGVKDISGNSLFAYLLIHDMAFYCCGGGYGMEITTGSIIRNSISYNNGGTGFELTGSSAYNSVSYNNAFGFTTANPLTTVVAQNNIVLNNTNYNFQTDSGAFDSPSSNNISSDATAPGANSLINQTLSTVKFVSTTAGIEDFHILPASVAKDAGTSLSPTFTTDIDNQTRPVDSLWDIGADETYRQLPYPTSAQTLTSSGYNSTDTANVIGALSWTEDVSLPTGTTVTVSLRAATSSANLTSSSWNDFTNATANCSKAAAVVTCPLAAIPASLKDGTGDQWFQYKVTLTSTGANTPTFSDLTLQYVVNAPPQFDTTFNTTGTTATQNSDGTVTIQYQIRDPDTTTGTVTPNAVTPSFEYSTNGGTNYSSITSTYLASIDLQNKTVGETTYTLYSATWNPKAQLGSSTYVTNAKVRVTLNDNEAANNTSNAATANFTLDTTNPVPGTPSLSVNPNSAAPTTAALTISATDNSSLQMKVGLASDLSDASWESYNPSKTITLATDPDTVYIQFKDAYGNTSSIVSGTTPETPSAMMIQDTSNLKLITPEYRLFSAWKVIAIPSPGFKQYNVHRSTDNLTFTQIATITNIATNYYGDSTVVFNQPYYYKVSSQDQNNNISFYSSIIQAQADGIQNLGEGGGGADGLPPTISSVTSSNIQTTQATINWTTDELSNSTVGYSTDTSFGTEQGVTSYVTSHSVTLINLTPNTAYKFQVKSIDPTGNQATNNNSGAGYTFTTQSGPRITNVDAEDISNTKAKIVWNTDKDSNSYIVYSTNSNLTSSTETGTITLVGGNGPNYYHSVTLSSLASGITYYYYVKSTDSENNIAVNNNGLNYYTFKTTSDTTSPTISNITVSTTTPDTAVITWITNEPATSIINYGLTNCGLTNCASTQNDDGLVNNHTLALTNLKPNTAYNFIVKSSDGSTNQATSSNQTFTTLEESKIKIDQIAPAITNIAVGSITSTQAAVTFTTNESCLGLIDYGTSTSYDKGAKEISSAASHSIALSGLSASTAYHFKAACRDSSDNTGISTDQTFTTLAASSEPGQTADEQVKDLVDKNYSPEDIQNAIKKLQSAPTITGDGPTISDIRSTSAKINWTTDKKSSGIIAYSNQEITDTNTGTEVGNTSESSLTHQVSLTNLIPGTTYYAKAKSQDIYGNLTTSQTKSFTTLIVPMISDVETSNITLTSVIINWKTSVISTGYLEYGPTTSYGTKQENDNPASQGTTHIIALTNLQPTTTYHFRIKGAANDNSLISSEDYTFNTQSLPEITQEQIKKITDNSAQITFQTNIPTDTQILFKPIKPDQTFEYEQKGKPDLTKTHEITLTDLTFGTEYDILIKVKDSYNNETKKQLPTFTTGIDLDPPTINLLRTENGLIPGKKDKVQTIITWKTNEPSTTQITYQQGIDLKRQELKEKTQEDKTLTKDHVVVLTTLKPGTVYQLRAIAKDNQQNQTISGNQTMLTPKESQSVFQIIIKNLEETFGWMRRIR